MAGSPDPDLRLVADRSTVRSQVERVASQVSSDHPDGLTLVTVLKSAIPFAADLGRALTVPVRFEFVSIAPFDGTEERARLVKDVDGSVANQEVVLVTGTFDTGLTADFLRRHLAVAGPRSVKVATFADKTGQRLLPAVPDYAAVAAPDLFLLGYGLDFGGLYRNLADVWAVDGLRLAEQPDRYVTALYGGSGGP